MGTVEVETAESVNHLEAMAQWAHLGRARAPFHLYVPAGSVDIARRLATENQVNVAEIWSYHTIGDQTRFTLVHRAPTDGQAPRRAAQAAAGKRGSRRRSPASRQRTSRRAAARKRAARAKPKGAREGRGQARRAAKTGPRAEEEVALPHLRFNRDKRGYENTFVVHSDRRRGRGHRASCIGSAPRRASASAARALDETPSG